jgi:hypothetical protein
MMQVPENTIAYYLTSNAPSNINIDDIVCKPDKKRDWFTPHFYRCLPLAIGNQYGFIIKCPEDISIVWNGGDGPENVSIFPAIKESDDSPIAIISNFGRGIVTVVLKIIFRTPPGVNLMTIAPPNYILPNISPMVGVIETDNLRYTFTFNLKIEMPNIITKIAKGYPIAAFIPIQRYYQDNFVLSSAEKLFDKNTIDEEIKATEDMLIFRQNIEPTLKNHVNKKYLIGEDIYGNKFKDHQKSGDI